MFARVPTILTPNYLIRVRVRARRIFPTQWKGGKARGGEVIADGSGLGLARGSVVRRYRVVWSPEDRMIAVVWKRKEKNAFAGKWRIGRALPPRAEKYELGCVTGGKDVSAVHNRACFSITREKTRNLYQRNGRARGCGANTSVARIVNVPSRINSRNFSRQFRHPFF